MDNELLDITKKSGFIFIGKLLGLIILFLFNFIVIKMIGSEIYGNFIYIYTFISFFPIICTLGLQQAMIFYIPAFINSRKYTEINSLVVFVMSIVFVTTISCITLLIKNSDFISEFILNNKDYSINIIEQSSLIMFISVTSILTGIFRGFGNVRYNIISENFISPIVKILSVILLVHLGFKINSIQQAFYISFLITSLYMIKGVLSLKVIGTIKVEFIPIYKDALQFGFPVVFTGILGYIIQRIDIFMIGFFLSNKDVGIYNIAVQIGTISCFILEAFSTIFASNISSLYHKGDINTLAQMYTFITKWIVFFNLIAFGIILNFSADIMHLFGTDFMMGALALILISIGQVVNAATGPAGVINNMTGHPHYGIYISIVVLIIGIALNYYLIPMYGINGAAFTSLLSITLSNLLRFRLMYKDHKIHPYNFQYIKIILAFLLSLSVTYILKSLVEMMWIIRFILFSSIYIGLFVSFNYLFGLSSEDKKILNEFIKNFKKKVDFH